ncbi:hypothetical protein RclHR1_00100022 [Rhizophagus clarus]|uniref:Uncharacterized protein n=1 Tax=Rhizophagus clarus TaxID=94130 RepID=A0A2Z6QQU2_9GLOM|nr:hypothetical protein RclHR1_00100022 [Rhizophagus clarus]
MLICTKKKCLFPFDVDDVSPYIIRVDSLVNTNSFAEPLSSSSSSSPSSPSSSSSSSLLDEKFPGLKTPSKSTSNLTKPIIKSKSYNPSITGESLLNPIRLSQTNSNGVLSTQSKKENSNLSNLESFSNVNTELSSTESNNLSMNSKSINVGSSLSRSNNEEIIFDSNNNNTITLKTLGVTLKVDQPNKNKLQQNSSQFNGLSTDISENKFSGADFDADADDIASTIVDKDVTSLFNTNDFPVSAIEGSSANTTNFTTGNGLLNANATSEVDGNNALTVEEYSKMLFGQTDIDINFDLDNMLPNFNAMDVDMQGNGANMENIDNIDDMDLDEILGTFNSLESSKISGNEMNLDFDSFMASLSGDFAKAEIPNDMSGNNLNVDSNTVLVDTNGMNGIQNNAVNGHLDIYAEMVNGNSNSTSENNSTLADLTFESVNGRNGYHENIKKTKDGVNGLVEDEGKNVVGKAINGDSVH